jgi:hypothetical protein
MLMVADVIINTSKSSHSLLANDSWTNGLVWQLKPLNSKRVFFRGTCHHDDRVFSFFDLAQSG